ncbi:MAG: WecB/TagA/CpsF family glycosyltransferase, partial [Bacillota bacterium]|nr:WecB/TagA/CpsF family glycosyltransferase [Bacillota bacterium]
MLGYKIFGGTKSELMDSILNRNGKINIVSGNPEVLYNGMNDKALFSFFNDDKSVIIPDGAGVVLTSKLIKEPVEEKIAGIEVMEEIIRCCAEEGRPIYLLGAEQEVVEKCAEKLRSKYPSLKIGGVHNGFFTLDNCSDIIEDINNSEAYALFVAMGSPRQERFIDKYMNELCARIYMGVGGAFDVFAGKVNRAPKWMIKLSIEWLYRVSKEPYRIKRLNSIPKFIYLALKDRRN